MIIVNADDWGRSVRETDATLDCYERGRITSVTAMMFMADSERAARIALEKNIPAGLHINFTEAFTGQGPSDKTRRAQLRTVRFLNRHKYMQLLYNPFLGKAFVTAYESQLEEFHRLYKRAPSHFDGHRHMHLCGNMLVAAPIPTGSKVRRTFSFQSGEKSLVNRGYRALVSRRLAGRYRTTDYFFSLEQHLNTDRLKRVVEIARNHKVELMTHPGNDAEYNFLMSEGYKQAIHSVPAGSYSDL
jgi:chitin disaccharide deacetylase